MNDTSPEIAAMVHARLMAKTGEERFLMGIRMHEAARRMVMASFPPGISDEQRKQLLFERFYGGDQGNGTSPAPNAKHFPVATPLDA
ncbi:MAG: hypothetical protein ACRDBP_01145 [Luteolibacter sp.]